MQKQLRNKLAKENPALLYEMLLKEKAEREVKCISQAAQDFLNSVKESIEEYVKIYRKDYGDNWQEVMEADWGGLYYEILEKKENLLLEYFRSII